MSFAFPSDDSEGIYTSYLHDEFNSATNWWFDNSDPSDTYIGTGDKWNANGNAGGGAGVIGGTGTSGFARVYRTSTSGSWGYMRSNTRVPANGAQLFYVPTGTTYAVGYSNKNWMALLADGEGPTSGPRNVSQYVVVGADGTYIKGPGGFETYIDHTRPYNGSAIRGFRIMDGELHYLDVDGNLLHTVTGLDLPTGLLNPVWGVGNGLGSNGTTEIRMDSVDVGNFTHHRDFTGWGLPI